MNQFRKYLLIGLTTLSLGTAACGALANPAGADSGKFAEHRAQQLQKLGLRLAALHTLLQLTPDQETAWQTFVKQMTSTAPLTRPDWSEWSSLPAPERLKQMLTLMQEHQSHLANVVLPAVNTFYAVLTPEQQKIFNE